MRKLSILFLLVILLTACQGGVADAVSSSDADIVVYKSPD